MIELVVNGKPARLEAEASLLDFLVARGINPQAIAVELNGEIVRRESYRKVRLRPGDRLEIVRMVGGGSPGAHA